MKLLFFFLFISLETTAQWSDTTNIFTNDLHMPVTLANGDQQKAMTIKSHPDNGYFVIWEDYRNGASAPTQIYAQKYNAAGTKQWSADGVVISSGTNSQRFAYNANQDYRNRNFAASDNAGGLYITYTDDSVQNYSWQRIMVQHLQSNGTRAFPGAGHIIARTPSTETYTFSSPQLIADNDGGFYLSYINVNNNFNDYVIVNNYSDESGVLKFHGGGHVNDNLITENTGNPCGGDKFDLRNPTTTVTDYNIWPDLQGNCSVVIAMNGNHISQRNMLCYNKVWKAKNDQSVTITRALGDRSIDTYDTIYRKGDVDILYKIRINNFSSKCETPPNIIYTWIDYIVIGQGYRLLDKSDYPFYAVKGATVTTGGNVNAELVTGVHKQLVGAGSVSDPALTAIGFTDEIYTAIPYQRASNNDAYSGYNVAKPAGLDTVQFFRDTLLAIGVSEYDYSLASGGKQVYAAALIQEKITDNAPHVRLQHLSIESAGGQLYRFKYETGSKNGALIGSELNTGFGTTAIDYDFPLITTNTTGNAVFTINEIGRYIRVSPIFKGAQLAWGAMGKPMGAPQSNGYFTSATTPHLALDPTDGTAAISWRDSRNLATTSQDIFIRHLDQLNAESYAPPAKKIKPFPSGTLLAPPAVFTGVSKKYSLVEAYNATTFELSPVAEILDNYDLGILPVGIFENTGTIRNLGGKAYLDRNYTFTPEHNPNGSADINVRLYFTTTAFEALKLADPGIVDPGSLSVIKQANASGSIPSSFIASGTETEIQPTTWSAVEGGYYLEIVVNSFSNFFIQKTSAALPLKWLGIQAEWAGNDQAKINWQVAEQLNVKDYIVQLSSDGIIFTDQCTVTASNATNYNCTIMIAQAASKINYFRVMQRDFDNKFSYSKTVTLKSTSEFSISLYPNPVKHVLYLNIPEGYRSLEIYDFAGRLLIRQSITAGLNQINMSKLGQGPYMIKASGEAVSSTMRIVKE